MPTNTIVNLLRRYQSVATFALLGLLLGGTVMFVVQTELRARHLSVPTAETVLEIPVGPYAEASEPTHIRIPAINLDASFGTSLGINDDSTIEVPKNYHEVGYYEHGPTPGELGPAVVLGHVDSFQGPAVFFYLRNLAVGDEIEIDRIDGTTAVFVVESVEEHAQTGFPTEKVYRDIDHAGLRLITCSGFYNHGTLRYSHNLIVYARLIEIRESLS